MREMGNLDYAFLLPELSALAGSHLEQFYELSPGLFRLRFKSRDTNVNVLADVANGRCYPASSFPESPRLPTGFASFVRKHFAGKRLESVEQVNFDRIIRFRFGGSGSLLFEFFQNGNALALDANNVILLPFKRGEYSARKIARGEAYLVPPQNRKAPQQATVGEVEFKGALASGLAKRVALPPFYLEEACAAAGLDSKVDASTLNAEEKNRLVAALKALPSREPSPRLFEGGFAPFALTRPEAGLRLFKSFGEALDAFYSANAPVRAAVESKPAKRLVFALQQQAAASEAFEARAGEARAGGDWISSNLDLVEGLLEKARAKDSEGLAELAKANGLKAKLDGRKLTLEPL
ncbi:MAG: NFACT family protein [Candidatus Micrarchaeia archaeon]